MDAVPWASVDVTVWEPLSVLPQGQQVQPDPLSVGQEHHFLSQNSSHHCWYVLFVLMRIACPVIGHYVATRGAWPATQCLHRITLASPLHQKDCQSHHVLLATQCQQNQKHWSSALIAPDLSRSHL